MSLLGANVDEQFEAALAYVQSGEGPELSQEALLKFYALFKQATDGPCADEAPSRLNVVAYEKWKAYKALGPVGAEEAMAMYIRELSKVAPGWSDSVGERRQDRDPPHIVGLEEAEDEGIPLDYIIVAGITVTALTAWYLVRRWRRARAASKMGVKVLSSL